MRNTVEIVSKAIPVTDRVQQGIKPARENGYTSDERLLERLKERLPEGLTVVNEESVKLHLVKRKALAEVKVLSEMPVQIRAHELLVGSSLSQVLFPDYATREEKNAAAERLTGVGSVFGHTTPYYPILLTKGLSGLRKEADNKLADVRRQSGDPEKEACYESIIIAIDGLKELVRRYRDLAGETAKGETNGTRKQELEEIAGVCQNLLERPPQTFREAIQALWFAHIAFFSTFNGLGLGRFDQNLWPYLKHDLENGTTTLEEAQEWVDLLWLKCNEPSRLTFQIQGSPFRLAPSKDEAAAWAKEVLINRFGSALCCLGGNNSWESVSLDAGTGGSLLSITLSGLTPEGKDGTNPLTYLCLNALLRLKIAQPYLYVRLHDGSPPELYERVADCIRAGCAGPTIYNDEVIIPALTEVGIPLEDAREYTSDGCYEVHIQGRTDFRHMWVSVAEALERVLNPEKWEKSKAEGCYIEEMDIWRGWQTPDPYTFRSFEEVMQAFKGALDRNVKGFIESHESFRDGRLYQIAPQPLLSAFMEGPLESGKDITLGGAKYIIYMVEIAGLATAADSLAVIKKLCFDENAVKLSEILDAIRNNWEGKEYLRQMVRTKVPAYGNDVDYVDEIARDIVQSFVESLKKHSAKAKSGTKYIAGVATFENYAALGRLIGATPDGRLSGEPLSDNASPAIGRAANGPTAAVNSFVKLPLSNLSGGSSLNLAMSTTSSGFSQLEAFLKSIIDKRANVVNIAVMDSAKLRAAQKEPEKYRDLIVRVGGYEAYFVDLPPKHQELQIRKCEHYT